MNNVLFKLLEADGVSGEERNVANTVKEILSKYAEVSTDINGNIFGVMGDKSAKKNILLEAHMDQIGFIVTYINKQGFLKVSRCGGIDNRVLPGCRMVLCKNKDIHGVFCCMPPHLSDGKEDKAVASEDLWIDVGLSFEEVNKNINLGDRFCFYSKPTSLLNNRIASAAIDNRAGVSVLLRCGELLSREELCCKVTFLLSVQEETGQSGAKTGTFSVEPDEAISVDVSFAAQPGLHQEYCSELSKGPMIAVASTMNRELSDTLIEISKKNEIDYQLEIIGGKTGTNADVISVTKSGVKCGVVSIPLRNMHTPVEVVDVSDIENTALLLYHFVLQGGLK
ncbi:MAG: M42 family peptidase [Bacillota bacterium]|nr:M42 family peptidase [Bacillota bacterium]